MHANRRTKKGMNSKFTFPFKIFDDKSLIDFYHYHILFFTKSLQILFKLLTPFFHYSVLNLFR